MAGEFLHLAVEVDRSAKTLRWIEPNGPVVTEPMLGYDMNPRFLSVNEFGHTIEIPILIISNSRSVTVNYSGGTYANQTLNPYILFKEETLALLRVSI